jgi:hypothetical protein
MMLLLGETLEALRYLSCALFCDSSSSSDPQAEMKSEIKQNSNKYKSLDSLVIVEGRYY